MSGPCVFCGFPDSRHRVVDAIEERVETGESWEDVLRDYGWTRDEFERVKSEVYPDG